MYNSICHLTNKCECFFEIFFSKMGGSVVSAASATCAKWYLGEIYFSYAVCSTKGQCHLVKKNNLNNFPFA